MAALRAGVLFNTPAHPKYIAAANSLALRAPAKPQLTGPPTATCQLERRGKNLTPLYLEEPVLTPQGVYKTQRKFFFINTRALELHEHTTQRSTALRSRSYEDPTHGRASLPITDLTAALCPLRELLDSTPGPPGDTPRRWGGETERHAARRSAPPSCGSSGPQLLKSYCSSSSAP